MRPLLRSACLLALALASGSAQALGLGQIQVRSGLGEPLLAEIPVVSNDPSELVGLDAALASPETFTRVGLEPPIGIVADLRFTVGSDPQGRPLIRITTDQPVRQSLLNFLIEVDWGQGRLVREYTATVQPVESIAAEPAAPVQAPVVDAPPVIQRPVAPVAAAPLPAAPPAPGVGAVQPAPAQPVAAATRRGSPQLADEYVVRAGDTASRIATRLGPDGVTAEQTMVGLLNANPDAFIGGDLNQLRQGAVLRVPAASELEAVEAREAAGVVRSFTRQLRRPRTQPEVPAQASAAPRVAAAAAEPSGRLEIVPPGAGRQSRGGTQSGIAAGGEGEMLRQELMQTKETLAAKDAEVQELKSRLADLEKLQADQQKLIAIQNAQLHAAQERKATAQPVEPAPAQESSPLPWIAGGALVLAGLLAAAWNRRRARREPVFRAPSAERPSIADAFAPPRPQPVATKVEAVAVDAVPSWQRGPAAAPTRPTGGAVRHAAPSADAPGDALASDHAAGSAVERLELAQAYVDLGESDNARRLLGEVMDAGDATERTVASRMLRDLG